MMRCSCDSYMAVSYEGRIEGCASNGWDGHGGGVLVLEAIMDWELMAVT